MKVLQICAYAAQYGGNFIASMGILEEKLRQQQIQTEYLFPETARDMPWCQELQKRAKVTFAGLNRFSPETYRQVARAMEGADVVHSHFELYDCLTALAKKKGQKLVWHLHDSFDEDIDLPHRIINKIQYGLLGKRAVLISPNEFYADYVVKLGFPGKQICHVANGADFSRLRQEQNPERCYDFLIFGGFYKIKGLDVLMDACRLLIGEGLSFRVGVVGYTDTWHFMQEQYPDVLPYIQKLMPTEAVSGYYAAAGAYISASRRETFSYSVLEALYMRVPAIISDIPGTSWAAGYESTLVFPSGDAAALAETMKRLLTGDHCPTEEHLEQTALDVTRRYSADVWAQRIKEIYFCE